MPRYDYTHHFACFACRKVNRRSPYHKVYERNGRKLLFYYEDRSVTCPRCGGNTVNMGRDFKAPRQDDLNQWATVELLHRRGIRYGPRPTNLRDAVKFLGDELASAEGKFLLRRIGRTKNKKT